MVDVRRIRFFVGIFLFCSLYPMDGTIEELSVRENSLYQLKLKQQSYLVEHPEVSVDFKQASSDLSTLFFRGNQGGNLYEQFCASHVALTNTVTTLVLRSIDQNDINNGIGCWKHLRSLHLDNCSIPAWIQSCQRLTELVLFSEPTTEPEEYAFPFKLEKLYLCYDDLEIVPKWASTIISLKELYIPDSDRTIIPDWLLEKMHARRIKLIRMSEIEDRFRI